MRRERSEEDFYVIKLAVCFVLLYRRQFNYTRLILIYFLYSYFSVGNGKCKFA